MSFVRRLLRRRDVPPEPVHVHSDEPVPGWDAITSRLAERYGDQEPRHWGTIVRWRLGGPDPLDGISAFDSSGPPAHWHYVSYGLSELYQKESDDPAVSGWGIELTFRLAKADIDAGEAPLWPASFMQNLARYVFETGNVFMPFHHMDGHGPIAADQETALHAAVFVEDPELASVDTPHGRVRFVQVVGITLDEYDAVRRWDTEAFVRLMREGNPLLVTDLRRSSLLEDAGIAARVSTGQQIDGSSMGGVYVSRLAWSTSGEGASFAIGADAVDDLQIMVDRLAMGRTAFIQGPTQRLDLVPGEVAAWHPHDADALGLVVSPPLAKALRGLPARAGRYTFPEAPGLMVELEQTVVRDQQGREVERIGCGAVAGRARPRVRCPR